MHTEQNLLPISALQHLLFCPRQCALIHIEQLWFENKYTAEGRIMHEKVHTQAKESRGKLRIEYSLQLCSLNLGLTGIADIVEFHLKNNHDHKAKQRNYWQPFPVEYKRGKPKKGNYDTVQLCAQALCLEEMLNISMPAGALFYGKTHKRHDILFDKTLRTQTQNAAKNLHELIQAGQTPKPVYSPKCENCSFIEICLPKSLGKNRSAIHYLKKAMEQQ
jgi:CRISPR-associated exonuclease Cas4